MAARMQDFIPAPMRRSKQKPPTRFTFEELERHRVSLHNKFSFNSNVKVRRTLSQVFPLLNY